MPDWKVCRMRGGSLLRQNCLRGCICVPKQYSIVSFCCFTKISWLGPRLKFKVHGREIGHARQSFQSGSHGKDNIFIFAGKEPAFQQHKILVLEAAPKMDPMNLAPEKYSNRVSSITPGTKQLLEGEVLIIMANNI